MSQYDVIRRVFNPAINGTNINAMLYAISQGDEYLRFNAQNLFLNLFTKTAVGQYLDILGANNNISRPEEVGISDSAYRRIIAETPNRQNTINAILNVLDIYFSNFQTRAYIQSSNGEPFTLSPGDNLSVFVDGLKTYNLVFNSSDFNNISSISALDLSNIITAKLSQLNSKAYAIAYFNTVGVPNQVRIVSGTLGPTSAIIINGGKANNTLKFSTSLITGQDNTTQFTVANYRSAITGLSGITTRFTWTSGTNPNLSVLKTNDYANIYGTVFNTANRGTYPIINVVNGTVNNAYFEVINNSSVTQAVTLSAASDILFFRPTERVVGSDQQYASAYNATPSVTQIFIPASTSVISRTPTSGGAYIPENYVTVNHSATTFTSGETVFGGISKASGVSITVNSGVTGLGEVQGTFVSGETITGETSGFITTISSLTKAIDNSVLGNYLIDTASFVITSKSSNLSISLIQGQNYNILKVVSTANFYPKGGFLRLDMGYKNQEEPVPYLAILNATDIQLDASYKFKSTHSLGADVTLLKSKATYVSPGDGSDRGSYLTDIAKARDACVATIDNIKSAGFVTTVTVLYPGDIGLGNAGTVNSDIIKIYGE